MKYTKLLIVVLLSQLIFTSCGSLNKVHPLHSTSILKDGLWGSWEDSYGYKVKTEYNNVGLNIYLYNQYNHPSDYDILIMIDKTSRTHVENSQFTYKGEIIVNKENYLIYDKGRKYCTILCDKKMDKSIRKNGLSGVLNIFYNNNTGRAFAF